MIAPLEHRLKERRAVVAVRFDTIGSKVTGVQTGSLLAFLATKVLGQYELFAPYDVPAPGRLLLVAPNIVAAEREMGVDPADFRLWVCLHEETHRVQFGAVPWLREHVLGEIRAYLDATEVDPAALARRLRDGPTARWSRRCAARRPPTSGALLEAVQTPAQREILDRLTALMSLLEGHADVVMDGVGPDVVPSVATIRERFQRRRAGPRLGRPAEPAAARARREDAPVPRRRRVRAPRGRRGGPRRVQPGLVRRRRRCPPAPSCRAGRVDRPGRPLARWDRRQPSPRSAVPSGCALR